MFNLTENHIKVLDKLYFRTIYSENEKSPIPTIDAKRPLCNSGIVFEVADILSIYPKDDNWTKEILNTIFTNIYEIPGALSIVLYYKTFEVGFYDTKFKSYVFEDIKSNLSYIDEDILEFQEYLKEIRN